MTNTFSQDVSKLFPPTIINFTEFLLGVLAYSHVASVAEHGRRRGKKDSDCFRERAETEAASGGVVTCAVFQTQEIILGYFQKLFISNM